MERKKFYVTTPIYYPNDKLHIGHAYSTVLADVISRFKKLDGYDVFFSTGSDEHGQKIEDKAKELKIDTLNFVTDIIKNFKDLWNKMNIDYTHFIRTTDDEHEKFVQNTFIKMQKQGVIYKGKYEGWYCKSDEAFFPNNLIKNNKCPECGKNIFKVNQDSYFLNIIKFKDWVKIVLQDTNLLIPKHRVKELINNFVDDLHDLSITRDNFKWGIPVPNDKSHVIYVWLDALLNYVSTLTYGKTIWNINDVWSKNSDCEILHIIGKEITRFHAIYWPIILKILDYKLPQIVAHGWIVTDDGNKMSKSIGNVIDPLKIIDKYGSDGLRFYLINNISTSEDGRFSEELLKKSINGILVNKFSNLVIRTDAMIKKYFNSVIPKSYNNISKNEEIMSKSAKYINEYKNNMNSFNFSNSTKKIIHYIEMMNSYIDVTTPWKEDNTEILGTILNTLIFHIWNISILLKPIIPYSIKQVEFWLNEDIVSLNQINTDMKLKKLKKIAYIFKRI